MRTCIHPALAGLLGLPGLFCAAAALSALLTAGLCPAADGGAERQAGDVRVMSFNVRYGTARDGENHWDLRKEFLVETIRAFDPDLLGTQETLDFQRDYLAEQLPQYGHLGAGRDDGGQRGEMMALYYKNDRFEKLDGGHFWLSETPEEPGSTSWDTSLPRMVTWVKLRDRRRESAPPIVFFNTHFDHRGVQARLESARLLRKRVEALNDSASVIVTGDFNAGEGSDPYRALFAPVADQASPLQDTYRIAHPERGTDEGTFSGFRADATGGARIDWIGVSRDWQVLQADIDRTARDGRTPSDHFPVTAVLRPRHAASGAESAGDDASADAHDRAGRKPNILFAFADDWGRQASIYARVFGPGGVNDAVQTPHFDRLAQQGVLFRNAHVNAPSCTPCRSALLSGQYFWRTGRGAILQGAVWDPEIPSYPLLLRDAGYHIGKTYKVWSPGTPVDAPYGGAAHAYQKAGGRFNNFSQNVTRMVGEGQSLEAAKESLYAEIRENFRAFLADREPDQPFCYWFGPTNVHRRWIRGSGKALWGLDPDALQGKMPPFLPDVHEVREDLTDYFGEIAAFDAALGLLIEELQRAGQWENTLMVVSGDHGPPGFPYGKCNLYDFGTGVPLAIAGPGVRGGRVVDDLVNLTDLAPTFLEAGGVAVPEVMTGRSLIPVLSSDAEGQVDPDRDAVFTGRERHVAMARAGGLPYPQRAIRTAEYALIINFEPDRYPLGDPYRLDGPDPPTAEELTQNTFATLPDEDAGPTKAWLVGQRDDPQWKPYYDRAYGKRPREELYDLAKDPHEVNNVAADPAYAEVRDELEQRLMAHLRRTGDPRIVDGGRFFESPPMAGPLPETQKPKRKP